MNLRSRLIPNKWFSMKWHFVLAVLVDPLFPWSYRIRGKRQRARKIVSTRSNSIGAISSDVYVYVKFSGRVHCWVVLKGVVSVKDGKLGKCVENVRSDSFEKSLFKDFGN